MSGQEKSWYELANMFLAAGTHEVPRVDLTVLVREPGVDPWTSHGSASSDSFEPYSTNALLAALHQATGSQFVLLGFKVATLTARADTEMGVEITLLSDGASKVGKATGEGIHRVIVYAYLDAASQLAAQQHERFMAERSADAVPDD